MPTPRATVNQVVQIGAEFTPGTAPAAGANKLVSSFLWTFGAKPTTKQFTGTGRKYPSASEELIEFSMGKISGQGDFNAAIYPLSSCFGGKAALIAPPAAPGTSTNAAGGTILAGTYQVIVSYTNAQGETIGSVASSQVTTGSTSTLTITSPAASPGATGWYAYVTQAGGNTYTRQQTPGNPTAIGTNLTLTAPPTSSGLNPQNFNSTNGITALHAPSAIAYDWTYLPPISGYGNPQTFEVQQGNSVDDSQQYDYLIFSGWGYTVNRKQEMTLTGDWFSQTFVDGATMTASPVNVPLSPIVGAQVSVFLDTTSANLGNTQLPDDLAADFKASGYYGQYFPLNRTNASYTSHLELAPTNELKLKLQANSTAIAMRGTYLQTGTRAYVRVSAVGPTIDIPNSIKAGFVHDMAVFVADMAEFSDVDGVYAVEYTLKVAEDTSWTALPGGTAQKLVVTNSVAGY